MSFHGGSGVMAAVIESVRACVPDEKHREEIYEATWEALANVDWGDEMECAGMDDVYDRMLVRAGYDADYVAKEAAYNRSLYDSDDEDDAED